ncbi:restriction endonuclease subunit S [Ruminococcus sp.]|uniref:restriction endonuclease subunit S n=1 Tax=Ruminococcus sp. TaxID=41978 RepID=UPI003967303E
MREMKDSGIEWIGIIPSDWKISRIKYVATFINGDRGANYPSGSDLVDEGIIFLTSNNIHGTMLDCCSEISKYITTDRYSILGGAKIALGDIIYCLRGSVGNCAINKEATEGTVASSLVDIRPTKIHPEYLNYILQSPINSVQTLAYMNGSCAANLSAENVANYYFIEPPVTKQRIISAFLDSKCSEIDSIISDIQSQIEALEEYKRSVITEAVTKGLDPDVEMRDSGVQWIGMMPTHWDCQRGKYLLRYVQKPVRDDDGVITCFRDGEVTLRSNRREEGFTMADKEIGYQGIDVGDLVVHGMDGFAGSIGISDSKGKASPVLNVLDTEQNKRYIMYYLRSMAYNDVFVALATGIRVRSCDLRWNKLAELLYPMPPVEEQQAIVEHIDSVLERTNAIIADKKQQIETIEEYKKSLIFEYVTGKKEVA